MAIFILGIQRPL